MFVAVDKEGNRSFASVDTDRSIEYYCPVCGGEVRLRSWKDENLNVPHFAHVSSCTDDFTADMSEWHRAWQELFPKEYREVVVTHGEEKHRADVLCYKTVIEFQHSPISESEFWRRNNFYRDAGYKVVWVFDVRDVYSRDRMECYDEWQGKGDSGGKYSWKFPWRMLSSFYPQDEDDISVFFQIVDFDKDGCEEDTCYMERIVWANEESSGYGKKIVPWGRFRSSYAITNKADLLDWLKDRRSRYKAKRKKQEEFVESNKPYTLLFGGIKGGRRWQYVCPRTKKFGLKMFGEGGCERCRYCLAIECIGSRDWEWQVYCKFPCAIHDLDDAHEGYDCKGYGVKWLERW